MNVSSPVNKFRLLPPILRAGRIAPLALFGTAINVAIFTSAVSTSAQEKTAPAGVSSEWLRMQEGLRKAKPMPEPKNGVRSAQLTPSGDLVGLDPATGQISRITPVRVEANSLINHDEGHPGDAPTSAEGSPRVLMGDGSEELLAGVAPRTVTPTPPRPFPVPYLSQPWMTQFRLLMRFAVSGFGDRYYLCSASSASTFHLLSAGHCVYNHDPLGDGTGRGAGFAAEIWAWPAQTDIVDPLEPVTWPDLPWGVAKMTHETVYDGWKNNRDFNWDFSFITLDRRIGEHLGWLGREWGVKAETLYYDGYPAEAPYVPSSNPFQYPGADIGNVRGYTCCRIQMDAFTYGGHSGGGVFRLNGTNWMIEGVNSTSTRHGYAEATLFTSQTSADLRNRINTDSIERPPVDRAQVIEYVFNTDSKGLFDTSVALGLPFAFKINAYNAGYTSAGNVTADVYLTKSLNVTSGTYIGSVLLGALNANQFIVQPAALVLPTSVAPGNYFLGWTLRAANPQYNTDNNAALTTKDMVRVVGLSAVQTNLQTVVGGTSVKGTVQLTSPAPANGLGHGIDVLLSGSTAAAQFINFVHIKEGDTSATFDIATSPVKQNTAVTITANLNGITRTTTILVSPKGSSLPAALNSLNLQTAVLGGNSATATVNLTGPAPAAGITVSLSSSNAKAVVPKSVLVNAGSASAMFTVKTSAVTVSAAALIKATYAGISKTVTLSINPVQPKTIAVSPSTVKGGAPSLATITVNGMAPPGGADISLKSSNTHAKVQPSIPIGPGSSSVTAAVNTTAVTANTTVTITATTSGVSKSATLTIKP